MNIVLPIVFGIAAFVLGIVLFVFGFLHGVYFLEWRGVVYGEGPSYPTAVLGIMLLYLFWIPGSIATATFIILRKRLNKRLNRLSYANAIALPLAAVALYILGFALLVVMT